MTVIIYWKKHTLRINDIYGNNIDYSTIKKADVHCYFQQLDFKNANKKNSMHKKVTTLCIELQNSEKQLRKEMNRTTRYQINKAGKDGLDVELIIQPTTKDVAEFTVFFNNFAKEKGIEKARVDKLEALRLNNQLVISYIRHENGGKMASHLYIADGKRATMFYSASARFEKDDIKPIEVGRANRYLHWQDILFFKQRKYRLYDFLGLSQKENDLEQQNINKFKKGFGGKEITEYQSYLPQTLKGHFALILLRWLWRNQVEIIDRKTIIKNNHLKAKLLE